VITNPPFDLTAEFIQRAHQVARRGVAMLMRGGLLEGQERHQLLTQTCPLTYFAPFSERVPMFKQRWDPAKSTASLLRLVHLAEDPPRAAAAAADPVDPASDLAFQGGMSRLRAGRPREAIIDWAPSRPWRRHRL
jgi:hypothetical protein